MNCPFYYKIKMQKIQKKQPRLLWPYFVSYLKEKDLSGGDHEILLNLVLPRHLLGEVPKLFRGGFQKRV